MSETRGIFGLTQAVDQKLDNNWVPLDQVWHSDSRFSDGKALQALPDVGYVMGGYASPQPGEPTSKHVFSTGTSSYAPSANLPASRQNADTASSTVNGYYGAGGPGPESDAGKISYSNDTQTFLPSVRIVKRSEVGATGPKIAGYFMGGVGGAPYPKLSTTYKITYSSDSPSSVPGANLTGTRRYMNNQCFSNETHGHMTGGQSGPGPEYTNTDRLTYATETTAVYPGATIPSGHNRAQATGGNETVGYYVQQYGDRAVHKITYSSGTFAEVPGATGTMPVRNSGTGMTGPDGIYLSGGENPSISPSVQGRLSSMAKLAYSTDTVSDLPSSANTYSAKYSGSFSVSAFDSGLGDRQPPDPTPSPVTSPALGPAPNFGYFAGGQLDPSYSPNDTSEINRIDFSSDTSSILPGTSLVNVTRGHRTAAISNGFNAYIAGGGISQNPSGGVDKFSHSTQTVNTAPGLNLPESRSGSVAIGNVTQGYFIGGSVPASSPNKTSTDKITYSVDLIQRAPTSANMSAVRYYAAATGTPSVGYNAGGYTNYTKCDKMVYATDTCSNVPSANMNDRRREFGATGNSTHGYYAGGMGPGSPQTPSGRSNIERLTYSNETFSVLPSGSNLTNKSQNGAAAGNFTHGYFAGGGPSNYTVVDKMTYSNDTTARVPGADLTKGQYRTQGFGARMNNLPAVGGVLGTNIV